MRKPKFCALIAIVIAILCCIQGCVPYGTVTTSDYIKDVDYVTYIIMRDENGDPVYEDDDEGVSVVQWKFGETGTYDVSSFDDLEDFEQGLKPYYSFQFNPKDGFKDLKIYAVIFTIQADTDCTITLDLRLSLLDSVTTTCTLEANKLDYIQFDIDDWSRWKTDNILVTMDPSCILEMAEVNWCLDSIIICSIPDEE